MNRYLYLLLCSHVVLTTSTDLPVCIVGAGASGLSAAHALEALGRRTVIFEAKDTIGGNAQNYYENNQPFYLGPLLIGNSSHPETMKIVAAVDVPVTTHTPESSWIFNWTTGETWSAPETPQTPPPEFLGELQRYTVQWQRVYGRFAGRTVTENVPDELTVSTTEWFEEQKYPLLHATLMSSLIAWGYGDVDELPIFYTLSIFTPASLTGTRLRVDFHEVFQRWSRQLTRSEIHLGSRVEHIDRSEETITIHYFSPKNGPSEHPCSDLVLAFPPTLSSLETSGLTLSPAEEAVFSAVRTTNYFSAAVRLDTPPLSFFQIATETPYSSPEVAGQPVSVEGQYNTSDISLLYALASHSQSVEEVAEVTLQTLSRINGDPANDSQEEGTTPVTDRDIKAFRHHPYYFPHFGAEALRGGLYDLFNELQGANRTYFTSGLNRVEHVEYVVVAAREVVQRYFSD
ncbi:hypothetical protein BJX65DRAFT_254918 [Aspergillus insuetus]